ncbi:amidase [Granulosicoccus sp.]|nr:amidase [Granulosicoccus sp.]MDB4223874.1 amidase [Granulosicoccus sp.]
MKDSLTSIAEQFADGSITSTKLTQGFLDRIDETDQYLRAWQSVNPENALSQTQASDERSSQNKSIGPLDGIPIGVKDIIDTADIPTERGSAIYKDRVPTANAAVIEKLREAGAIILGKTVTTEFAWFEQSVTRNAVKGSYSPGGSSSGSAAAVAAGHVTLALGTQTGGSVIRPASYNGVFGYKPSRGLLSRRGVFQTSQTLDHVGVFGNHVSDLCILVDALSGYDVHDPASTQIPKPKLYATYLTEAPAAPSFAWIDMPYSDRYSHSLNEGINALCSDIANKTSAKLDRIPAPEFLSALPACHKTIYDVEILKCLDTEWNQHRSLLSNSAIEGLQHATTRTQDEYQEALGILKDAQKWFETFFHDYDGILNPSAPDIAPLYGDGTGDSICCVVWTLCGLPCISMPLLTGNDDMPLGIQLIGAHGKDDHMMRTAQWLLTALNKAKT